MQIDMADSEAVLQKPYPITMNHYDWVRSEINKLFDAQVICNSHSSWSAPGDGGKHLVISYKALNKVTWKFLWPMPRVEDIFSGAKQCQVFLTTKSL